MSDRAPVTVAADRGRAIPDAPGARADRIAAALASLGEEQRRLERLGFEDPLRRCHQERRYWAFLAALFHMSDAPPVSRPRGAR